MKNEKAISPQQCQTLLHWFSEFEEVYKECTSSIKDTDKDRVEEQLIDAIKAEGLSLRFSYEQSPQSVNSSKKVQILAKIFALWSVSTAVSESEGEEVLIVYEPHAAQIVSIFLLLCLDKTPGEKIIAENRLTEVKTGEGKSISLAVVSIYLSIFGYEVHCACYSEILSSRDEKEFQNLFTATHTYKNIKYGIF